MAAFQHMSFEELWVADYQSGKRGSSQTFVSPTEATLSAKGDKLSCIGPVSMPNLFSVGVSTPGAVPKRQKLV